jgi:hypothetical protein
MDNKKLIKKLEQAYQVCRDCGFKYGVYSVGCSSIWEGVCNVCDETKLVTETRDYAYLVTGIRRLKLQDAERPKPKAGDTWLRDDHPAGLYIYDGTEWVGASKTRPFSELTKDFTPERKAKIKQQSEEVAKYMLTQKPIMTDEDLNRVMNPSYAQGEITLNLTEDEVAFLNECLDVICENHKSLCAGHNNERPEDVAIFESVEKKITELYQDYVVKYELSPAMKKYHELYGTFGSKDAYDLGRWDGFREAFVMNAEVAK